MKIAIIMLCGFGLIHLFKRMGMTQLACGLLSGFLASVFTNIAFYLMGEPGTILVLSLIGLTAMSVVYGMLVSRKVYGLPGLFDEAQ